MAAYLSQISEVLNEEMFIFGMLESVLIKMFVVLVVLLREALMRKHNAYIVTVMLRQHPRGKITMR